MVLNDNEEKVLKHIHSKIGKELGDGSIMIYANDLLKDGLSESDILGAVRSLHTKYFIQVSTWFKPSDVGEDFIGCCILKLNSTGLSYFGDKAEKEAKAEADEQTRKRTEEDSWIKFFIKQFLACVSKFFCG